MVKVITNIIFACFLRGGFIVCMDGHVRPTPPKNIFDPGNKHHYFNITAFKHCTTLNSNTIICKNESIDAYSYQLRKL